MKFEKCKCGSTLFYMRQSLSGICDYILDCDGNSDNNEGLYESIIHKDTRKHYRCYNCDKVAKEVTE
ncbi:hypothetical protein [Streptococcus uberis]|uniref:hypothetical protein n=1 Tax=Streptococcus uberis TaxID=1349 RepID=UPI003D36986E